MKQKVEPAYEVQVNGMPDYGKIPKATLEPIAKKLDRKSTRLNSSH